MKTYNMMHICIKSDNEVMHRNEEDYRCGITKMALAAYLTDSHIYAYAFMSTHVHIIVQSPACSVFVNRYRSAYTRWFNCKYGRRGSLGEYNYHTEHLGSLYRALRAINYVLRNPVHHLVSDTAIGYEFCSARYVFAEEFNTKDTASARRKSRFYSNKIVLPQPYWLNDTGMIAPVSFLETSAVENMYMTAKNYLYQINRPSYKDLEKSTGGDELPLTIDMIEPCFDISEIQQNERQRSVKDYAKDLKICKLIDEEYLNGRSYAQIGEQEKRRIANALLRRFNRSLTVKQISRCLALQ